MMSDWLIQQWFNFFLSSIIYGGFMYHWPHGATMTTHPMPYCCRLLSLCAMDSFICELMVLYPQGACILYFQPCSSFLYAGESKHKIDALCQDIKKFSWQYQLNHYSQEPFSLGKATENRVRAVYFSSRCFAPKDQGSINDSRRWGDMTSMIL